MGNQNKPIPVFKLIDDNPLSVYNDVRFHNRIIELIEDSLNGGTSIILCHILNEDDYVIVAELEPDSYEIALTKSLEYYIENEDYEICAKIKKLLNNFK